MKKFVIIGANSSLARNFLFYLKDKACVKLYDIQKEHIDGHENYCQIDLLNKQQVSDIDFDCDAAFIFSGLCGADRSNENAGQFIDVNEKVLVNILEAAVAAKTSCRIVYLSSRLVYKDSDKPLAENDELQPKSIYALNKVFAEQCLQIFGNVYGIKYTIFRIAIPYGELNPTSKSYGIVDNLVEQGKRGKITLFGDGSSVRTFSHIKDICYALYCGGVENLPANEIYNIGGHVYSLLEISELIGRKTGCGIEFIPWPKKLLTVEVKNGALDSTKLDKILGIKYLDIGNSLI